MAMTFTSVRFSLAARRRNCRAYSKQGTVLTAWGDEWHHHVILTLLVLKLHFNGVSLYMYVWQVAPFNGAGGWNVRYVGEDDTLYSIAADEYKLQDEQADAQADIAQRWYSYFNLQ